MAKDEQYRVITTGKGYDSSRFPKKAAGQAVSKEAGGIILDSLGFRVPRGALEEVIWTDFGTVAQLHEQPEGIGHRVAAAATFIGRMLASHVAAKKPDPVGDVVHSIPDGDELMIALGQAEAHRGLILGSSSTGPLGEALGKAAKYLEGQRDADNIAFRPTQYPSLPDPLCRNFARN
jgi:hypothetical protein